MTLFTTVFVDTRLWKTKRPRKRFQNFHQSCLHFSHNSSSENRSEAFSHFVSEENTPRGLVTRQTSKLTSSKYEFLFHLITNQANHCLMDNYLNYWLSFSSRSSCFIFTVLVCLGGSEIFFLPPPGTIDVWYIRISCLDFQLYVLSLFRWRRLWLVNAMRQWQGWPGMS